MLGRGRNVLSFAKESELFFSPNFHLQMPYINTLPLPIVGREGSNSPVSNRVRVRVTTCWLFWVWLCSLGGYWEGL